MTGSQPQAWLVSMGAAMVSGLWTKHAASCNSWEDRCVRALVMKPVSVELLSIFLWGLPPWLMQRRVGYNHQVAGTNRGPIMVDLRVSSFRGTWPAS